MINVEKLEIYQKFKGDIDWWARLPSDAHERTVMTSREWRMIEELLNRSRLYGSGLTAASFDVETERLLRENVTHDAREHMRTLAEQLKDRG